MCDKEKEVRPLVGNPVAEVLRGDVQLLCTVRQVSHIKVKKAWMRDNSTKGVCSKIERPGQEGTTQQPTRTMLTQFQGATETNLSQNGAVGFQEKGCSANVSDR